MIIINIFKEYPTGVAKSGTVDEGYRFSFNIMGDKVDVIALDMEIRYNEFNYTPNLLSPYRDLKIKIQDPVDVLTAKMINLDDKHYDDLHGLGLSSRNELLAESDLDDDVPF